MSSDKDQGFVLASEISKKHNIITIYKMGSEGLYYFNNKKKKTAPDDENLSAQI